MQCCFNTLDRQFNGDNTVIPVTVHLHLILTILRSQLEYDSDYGSLVSKKSKDSMDGVPLAAGLACLLKQMHPSATAKLMSYLGQYVRSKVQETFGNSDAEGPRDRAPEIPQLVLNILIFLDQLCKFSSIPRSTVHEYVPPYIFDSLNIPHTK